MPALVIEVGVTPCAPCGPIPELIAFRWWQERNRIFKPGWNTFPCGCCSRCWALCRESCHFELAKGSDVLHTGSPVDFVVSPFEISRSRSPKKAFPNVKRSPEARSKTLDAYLPS